MMDRKEEFSTTQRYEKLRKMLVGIDQREDQKCQKANSFDRIVEILSLPGLDVEEKIFKIKKVALTFYEDKNV
jgi:hypothetical protein